jgi:hypothetical protein
VSDQWVWTYQGVGGAVPASGPTMSSAFPTQADAEAWLGQEWQELVAAGLESVSLVHGDHLVYGPMPLRPAD